MSWQHTSIWSWERGSNHCLTSCLHLKGIMNGEHLGNVPVYLSLSKAALLLPHLSKATLVRHLLLPMASSTQITAIGK